LELTSDEGLKSAVIRYSWPLL